jgi:3-hydroxyacyl-CoA dehydrogenase
MRPQAQENKMADIKKIAVVGAGVMGAAIAAQCANAGIETLLFDIVKDPNDRNSVARGAIEKMLKTSPAPFMHEKNARLVTPCNLEDDLGKLADVDWVIEAVIERLDIKHDVYSKIDKNRRKDTIVSSNTSTIPLAELVKGQSAEFQKHFLITHFFNPPRYMHLLELVASDKTDKAIVSKIADVGDKVLGKGIVHCKDTAGFIANRLGVYWMTVAINEAMDRGVTVQEADAMMGKPMGIPKTGVFGLVDLVGIDLMPHLSKSLLANLPAKDAYRDVYRDIPLVNKMIADGYTGRKGKGGFYHLNTEGGKKQKEVIDLKTGEYAPEQKITVAAAEAGKKGPRAVLEFGDKNADFAKAVMLKLLHYAASLIPEIADDIVAADNAMKWGFNWKFGPFEMIDKLGADWVIAEMEKAGMKVPSLLAHVKGRSFYTLQDGKLHYLDTNGKYVPVPVPEGQMSLAAIKAVSQPLAKNASASLWDIGDSVVCLEFHSKMNAIDTDIFAMYGEAIKKIGDGKGAYKALVVYNEGENFSVGANIGLALFALNVGLFEQIDELVASGQKTYMNVKYAPFPVVAAPFGMALGGGCEILLHVDAVVAHAETYTGLVEVGVGLIPGWGGCKEMLLRQYKKLGPKSGPMPPVIKSFEALSTAKTSTSAAEAFSIGYFRDGVDSVVMNRDRLLFDAKKKALELAKDYVAPSREVMMTLPGPTGKAAMMLAVGDFQKNGKATPYDGVVCDALSTVLSGGDTDHTVPLTEDQILKLEKQAFMTLVRNEGTLKRIEVMLETGKPLRN